MQVSDNLNNAIIGYLGYNFRVTCGQNHNVKIFFYLILVRARKERVTVGAHFAMSSPSPLTMRGSGLGGGLYKKARGLQSWLHSRLRASNLSGS